MIKHTQLNKSIISYLESSRDKLSGLIEPVTDSIVYLESSKKYLLLKHIEELEADYPFNNLVENTKDIYSGEYHGKSKSDWHSAVKTFFRKSGYYLECLEKKEIDLSYFFKIYKDIFEENEFFVRYLAPLEGVFFSNFENMDFGLFSIKRFSEKDLNEIVGNRVNKIFYPYAVWDTKKLSMWWFVEAFDKDKIPAIGKIHIPSSWGYSIQLGSLGLPDKIKIALFNLVLFDWRPKNNIKDEEFYPWDGFEFGFVNAVNNNLIIPPNAAPDTSKLQTIPYFYGETGDEIGEEPLVLFDLNAYEKRFLRIL